MLTSYPEIKVKLDPGAYLPERAHDTDAGADIRTPRRVIVPAAHVNVDGRVIIGSATINTGVHIELPPCTDAEIWSKSGLNVNHGIIATGLIDEGYDGAIVVKLYNLGDRDYTFERGSKLTQLVVRPVCYPTYVEASEISAGERGSNGFGSTGSGRL
jgi:dUTP pyrophosphatase